MTTRQPGPLQTLVRRLMGLPVARPSAIEKARALGASIGEGCRIFGTVDRVNPHLVTIGDYCVLGTQSAVLAHCPIRGPVPVRLHDFVWTGFNVLVLPGVEIGACSIIGAGAVVTKSVPERSIAVGNPARVLRALSDDEANSLMQRLRTGEPIGLDPDGPRGTGHA
ncbi:MAG: acyltransferase [Planctomycetota bacterium]